MSDQKFSVPEPPTGMGSGFLTEYWRQGEPLPRISGWEVAWYFLQRGFQTVVALPMSAGITVMTIAVSLFLLSSFLLGVQNVGRLVVSAGSTFYVTVYLKENVPEKDLVDFTKGLENNRRVRSIEYVSKSDALESFRRQLGPRSAFLEGLEGDNPLPASVDIVLQPDELGADSVNVIIDELRKNDRVVDEVVFGNEWVEKVQGILKVFRLIGGVSLLIILLIVIFLIANTIKLVFYARRDEIGIMQLVGASEWFVKTPFIIGGLLQGLVGSVFALLLLRLSFGLLRAQLASVSVFGMVLPEFSFLSGFTVVGILLLGLIIGAVGSFFSLGRFMNV